MRINLLAFHGALNYGAVWQIYSLSNVLKNFGGDVRLIDLRLPWDWPQTFTVQGIKEICHPIASRKRCLFKGFLNEYLPARTRVYTEPGELAASPPLGDVFVVGSDQVWNPEHTKEYCLDYFFYPFSFKTKKISYGASFGSEKPAFTQYQKKHISLALKTFDHVSVRERSAINICKTFGAKSVTHVLDPVFLPSDKAFRKICRSSLGTKYWIASYKFYQDQDFLECLNFVSKKLNRKTVLLHVASAKSYLKGFWGKFPDRTIKQRVKIVWYPSPLEWLSAIRNSSFIFTDSFHGTAFAIRFRKNFIVTVGNQRRFARIMELLKELGLEDRIFTSYNEIINDRRWEKPINFDHVYRILDNRINASMEYIEKALLK